jgi:hypothetical protein
MQIVNILKTEKFQQLTDRYYPYFALSLLFILILSTASAIWYDEARMDRDMLPFVATTQLRASVSFDGRYFVISNLDDYDWKYVKLQINSGLLGGGYSLKTRMVDAGSTIYMDSIEFADVGGNHPARDQIKPQNFTIWCDTPCGYGYWYREWENI